jgi:hypothetical protein
MAGVLTQIPDRFFRKVAQQRGFPSRPSVLWVGFCSCPRMRNRQGFA